MPETVSTQEPKIASLGKTQRVTMNLGDTNTQQQQTPPNIENSLNIEGANATSEANTTGAVTPQQVAAPAPTTITDETLKDYFKSQGIDYEGLDKLKEKLNAKVETAPTPEQLQEAAKAKEKKVIDKFVAGGGTVEQYVALKNLTTQDLAELSKNSKKAELKNAGFNDAEIDKIIKERYYQIDDEEIEQEIDESDKAFKKRSKEFFANKLANGSAYLQKQAAGILEDMQKAVESEDLYAKNELTLSANIDEQFKSIARKDTYEIGEINGKAIPPIESEVPESELAKAFETLKDPVKRKQFLSNPDGSENITNIAQLIAENAKLKAALKVSYHEGSTRTNAHWEKTFGAGSPYELGIGGVTKTNNATKGTPVSIGKVQRVQPQAQNR